MKRFQLLACALFLTSGLGCDKVKSMAHMGDADGSAAAASGGGALGSLFDSGFEGAITIEMTGKGEAPKTIEVDIKSPKLRVDLSSLAAEAKGSGADAFFSQGSAFILDPPAKKAYFVMPAKKMAMVLDFEKMKQQSAHAHPAGHPAAKPTGGDTKSDDAAKIDKTGKKEVVAGYTCEDWKITSKDGERADLCMAEGIKLMNFTDLASASPQLAAMAALGDLNHFPLKAVAYDAANVEKGRIEAKKIEKKSLPDAQFTVPADYQQMDMAQMMAAFAGGGHLGGPPGHLGAPPGHLGAPAGHPGAPAQGVMTNR